MLQRSDIKKTIAIFLIFTLTFTNFALLTKSYATTILDTVFSGSSDTGSKNVEFEAYLGAKKARAYSANGVMNDDSVKLNLDLKVEDSGYLKNTQIEIKEKEDNPGLNFKIEGEFEESDYVKSFENNILMLKQINKNSEVNLELPLTYNQEEYITLDKLSKDFDVVLTGTYVNDKAEEVKINKVVTLNLTWTDEREVKLSSEVTKYVPYIIEGKSGVILQTLIKVDSTAEKSGAVKSTNLEIEVPKIEGAEIKKVNVIAKSTLGTDGKTAEKVEFSENNWNLKEGILTINKENPVQLIKDEIINEDNTLLEENKNAEEIEKYFSNSGEDEYLVTYTFENVSSTKQVLVSNVKATITTFGKEDLENKSEKTFEYQVSEQLGDIVTYEIQNDTESVSKGYTYINYNNENGLYEIEYNSKEIVNISNKDIVEEIYVRDLKNNYVDKTGQIYELNDVYYKSISVSKSNFEEILGKEGIIEILREDGTAIAKFTKDTEADENGNLVYKFDEYTINNVTIKTSKPEEEGNLIFSIEKVQKQTSYEKSTFATFDYIEMNSKAEAKYTDVENLVNSGEVQTKIKLEDTTTKANLELNPTSISTLEPTNVEMKIKLNNHNINSDIYGNSTFEILLPEYIEAIEITDYNIIYGDGLNLSNVETFSNEEGRLVIKATIEGIQKDLSSGSLIDGTNIVFNSTIKAKKYTPLIEKDIELKVINSEATNYINDGISTTKLTYSSPPGVVAINTIKNYDEAGNELTSIKQGTKKATISTYSNSINPTMEFIVMNNNTNAISNISILGKVPFEGKQDVLNGEDLETTINTPITSRIISDSNNNTNFKIYYSANSEATNDLDNSSNGWKEEIDLGDIKSFLIIPEDKDYEMQESEVLKFSYEFNIPENLDFDNDIYTDFSVCYKNNSELANQEEISIPDSVYLTTGTKPQLELETTVDSEEVTKNEELTVTPEATDTGETALGNFKPKIPEETTDSQEVFNEEENTTFQEEMNMTDEKELVDNIPKIETGKSKITGCVWIDDNSNGIRNDNEKMKVGTKVILVDSDTGIIKDTVTTDSTGTYEFDGLTDGNYFVLFEYDVCKYSLTAYQKEGVSSNNNSDVISTQFEQNGISTNGAITDVIKIADRSISNIDMGLVIENTFDLQLTESVSKITVQNDSGITTSEYDNLAFAKKEIPGKDLASSTAYIEYTITVENKGDVEGYAKSIVDYIPEGLIFNSDMNPDWYIGADGNLYTNCLADKALAKGQKEEVKLILTKKMTEENTGMFNNTAEITEDYNVYGLSDFNSKPGNKVESENDFGSANVIISVKTGEVFIYTSIMLTTILLGGIVMFIIISKLKIKKRKEGGV